MDSRQTERLRWGILGTGKIAAIIASAIADSETAALVAIGSREETRANELAGRFGIPAAYGSYDEVIEHEDVDLVYFAIPHPFHREWAMRGAEAGKALLCEKPLGVDWAQARDIVEAARRHDIFLTEAFAYRCHPQTHRLVELVESGAIGEVRVIDAVFGYDAGPAPTNYLLKPELGGGAILDVGCYATSMSHLLAAAASGAPVVQHETLVGAGRIGPTGVDLSAAATLVFASGHLARVACSIEAGLDSQVRVYGSEGSITVTSPWLPGRIGSKAAILVERYGRAQEQIETPLESDPYTIEVDFVSRIVLGGERSSPWISWEDSLANMRTLDQWRAAVAPEERDAVSRSTSKD